MYDYDEEDNEYFGETDTVDYGKALRTINKMYEDFGYLEIYDKQGEKIDLNSGKETILENMIGFSKEKSEGNITTRSMSDIASALVLKKDKASFMLEWKKYDMDKALDRNLTGYNRISTKESWYEILSRPKGWETQSNNIQNEKSSEDKKEILALKEKIEELEENPAKEESTNKKEVYIEILEKFIKAMNYEVSKFEEKNEQYKKAKKECKIKDDIQDMNEHDLLYAINEFPNWIQVEAPGFFVLALYILEENNIQPLAEDDI